MSEREKISDTTKLLLWAMSAGRCQKCGRLVYKHPLSDTVGNFAQIAHNLPVGGNGPRCTYKKIDAGKDINEIDNLLLLCHDCHREIDVERSSEYTPPVLMRIKKDFEEYVLKATNIKFCEPTFAVKYSPNLHGASLQITGIQKAIFPNKYIEIERDLTLSNSSLFTNDGLTFWETEKRNLANNFERFVMNNSSDKCRDYSVFAIGPIPLLIVMGALLTNKKNVEVYQLRKTPSSWEWESSLPDVEYKTEAIDIKQEATEAVLLMSLSGQVAIDNVKNSIAVDDKSIYKISITNPNDDFLRTKNHLFDFIDAYRKLLAKMLSDNPMLNKIHLLGAVPNSIAVEIGRQRNVNVDPILVVYEFNNKKYTKVFEVNNE